LLAAEELTDRAPLIEAMKETGINTLELDSAWARRHSTIINKNKKAWGIRVSSLHAVCPSAKNRGRGGEEFFLISDLDENQRQKGVRRRLSKRSATPPISKRGPVVLHCGRHPGRYGRAMTNDALLRMRENWAARKRKRRAKRCSLKRVALARKTVRANVKKP